MKKIVLLFAALGGVLAVSCTKEETAPVAPTHPSITAILPGDATTKASFEFTDWRMKASWKAGDQIAIVPDGYDLYNAAIYTLPSDGGSNADFRKTKDLGKTASKYLACFPGDRISSYAGITRFSMEGQVQKKSDPMGHLADYFCMFKEVTDYSTVDFSDAQMSSFMRMDLSGSFDHPEKIELKLLGGGSFLVNCIPDAYFSYYYTDAPDDYKYSNSLTLELEGYGNESRIEAWLAMSNYDVSIVAGSRVRVKVFCADGVWYADFLPSSDMLLTGGNCHSMTVDSGWKKSTADFTEYSFDGEVTVLQEAGLNLDLVVMGDGFIAEDFDGGDNSTYMKIMKNAADQFFNAQPYVWLRDKFNVYIVKAVSPERTNAETTGANGARNTGTETKFSVSFTPNSTSVSGDNDTVFEYASKAISDDPTGARFANVTVIVIANQACRAGTCWNFWTGEAYSHDYGYSNAVAYFGLGTTAAEGNELVRHETSGHGFGKLADEYFYSSYKFNNTGLWNNLRSNQAIGLYKNVDAFVSPSINAALGGSYELTDQTNVIWADLFGTENNYESAEVESLGVFEGGYVYSTGFCRPTYDGSKSIMNQNTGIFNAISRRLILYRANNLMGTSPGSFGSPAELAWFLDWDKNNMLPHISEYLRSAPAPSVRPNFVEEYVQPLAPPHNLFGHFEGTHFIEE